MADTPPPLDFVLPGLLAGTVGLLVGAGGCGKSMLAAEMACSVAAGADVFGIVGSTPARGRAVYLSAEDPAIIWHYRLRSLGHFFRPDDRDRTIEDLDVMPVCGLGCSLADLDDLAIYAQGARLIVLDTLNRLLCGANENDNSIIGAAVSTVERLATRTGAAVLIVHHMRGIFDWSF
jgi:RecA-family ATPase